MRVESGRLSCVYDLNAYVIFLRRIACAHTCGKNHRDVLRATQQLECSQGFRQRNFALASTLVAQPNDGHRHEPMVEMTRDGFVFLVMGFTGKMAAQVKEIYIDAFNAMEADLARRDAEARHPERGLPAHIQALMDEVFPPHLSFTAEAVPAPAPKKRQVPGKKPLTCL